MSADLIVAIAAGVLVPLLIAGAAALWKLATSLAELKATATQELTHNGGSSLKDHAKRGADDATAARIAAEYANARVAGVETLLDNLDRRFIDHMARVRSKEGEHDQALGAIGHDVRNVRLGLRLLTDHVDRIDADRLAKEAKWAEALGRQGIDTPAPSGVVPRPRHPDEAPTTD